MADSAIVESILREAGLTEVTVTEPQRAYRGAPKSAHRRVLVRIDGAIAVAVSDHIERLQGIRRVQDAIPQAAKILEVVPAQAGTAVALIEYIEGTLLWELESDRPSLSAVEQNLLRLASDLGQVGLVHADLRPWNIFYQADTEVFRCIDWGFAFFIGGRKYNETLAHLAARGHANHDEAEIDAADVDRTIRVLKDPWQLEIEWHHDPNIVSWRPSPWE